ncbi:MULTISPECIES: FAD-dependent oxidoreductase [unclassified Roseovarius]|uniref:FAD-dependent oxidoreductase n=1 Tax=unclassified Roseovarius TaxID=2614913 RepID=UPI00273DC87A|nr:MULTISPECIES: FAD-dependent oxidoreductase [unclassified Roseovarius]
MDKKVAIIGGGISGLSVAYTLVKNADFNGEITVFEARPTLGGNADTANVYLGSDFRGDCEVPFVRKADLGVNDVNITVYDRLRHAMADIGYFELGRDEKNLRKLEDTVCFFTGDGQEIWTKDQELIDTGGVVDLRFSLQNNDHKELREAEAEFMRIAAEEDFNPDHEQPDKKDFWYLGAREYVEYFRTHRIKQVGDRYHPFSPELLDQVARLFLMPRIAAMYFAPDQGPDTAPFRGVMSYYRLQEGYGTDAQSDRRYFRRGSQDWINALAEWLEGEGVRIVRNFKAKVQGDGDGGVHVMDASDGMHALSAPERFGRVVMATHADHQLAALPPGKDGLLNPEMADLLSKIEHSVSRSVAHTYAALLPANVDSWRTYNVMIRDGAGLIPYQMTYVQNRHRNDRESEEYDEYGLPVYFVSLNPQVPIPDKYVLDVTPEEKARRVAAQPGYGPELTEDHSDAGKAVAWFRHTVMTDDLLEVQAKLPLHQGKPDPRIYFAGCWTNGAGLHEECFEQAERVVAAIMTSRYEC